MKKIKGRGHSLLSAIEVLSILSAFLLFLMTFLFSLATAFLFSCTKTPDKEEEILGSISLESKGNIIVNHGALDIFIYNLDKLGRLDSHSRQEFSGAFPLSVETGSRAGMKRVIVLANWPEEELNDWSRISALENILLLRAELEKDNPSRPIMTGSATFKAELANYTAVSMQALSAKIKIASVCCDFSGKSYAGQTMKNARVYLTNVCVSTTVSPDDCPGYSYVNIGGLSQGDMDSFKTPEYLMRNITEDIGHNKIITDISLFCYPTGNYEESAGRPQTKLVLEGDIGGRKYYYPIRLCDFINGPVKRETIYQIDLRITKLGGDDPDLPVSSDTFEATVQVLPWEDTAEQKIDF